MKLVNVCPDIPDGWRGGISEASKLLGLCQNSLRKYAMLGRSGGGIDWKPSKGGKKQFTGREIKRFWREF